MTSTARLAHPLDALLSFAPPHMLAALRRGRKRHTRSHDPLAPLLLLAPRPAPAPTVTATPPAPKAAPTHSKASAALERLVAGIESGNPEASLGRAREIVRVCEQWADEIDPGRVIRRKRLARKLAGERTAPPPPKPAPVVAPSLRHVSDHDLGDEYTRRLCAGVVFY